MSRAAYSRRTCRCGKEVSVAGCAYHAHMMAHVRREEAGINRSVIRGVVYTEFYWIVPPKKQKS